MLQVHDHQCGMCRHFGEDHPEEQMLMQIRQSHEAPEGFVEECGLPEHAALHLQVTAVSGCDGFEPVVETDATTG